jgi:2,3-bisphosphoglycerate-independent phosphoglycerate mutase
LVDYSAGHISNDEGRILIGLLEEKLGGGGIKFYPGVGYRHLLVVKEDLLGEGKGGLQTIPPHDITGLEFQPYLPRGRGSQFLNDLIQKSLHILARQEINSIRIDLGENPANMIWPWGEGKALRLPSFEEKYHLRGSLISAVDLLKGIALAGGLKVIEVPGATGYFDTDYGAKGRAALEALRESDFVYVHVEAPDEAGHLGRVMEKIKAIEAIDEKIVGPLLEAASEFKELRVAVLPDHATPIAVKTHTDDPVPFAIWGTGIEADRMESYSESAVKKGRFRQREGHKFLPLFFRPIP